ncbi:MAG: MOSC N-terminal beta barrel domain-containing protein [Elusimicrobiota bacterium]|nr:MOSC N-terminal beta barrel domain-containing protein [Elusimicrobiota bacterium]
MTGTVTELWRYPVKSMDGGRLDEAAVTPRGIPGDRAWALIDRATGKPLSGKRHAKLLLCRSRYLDEPTAKSVPPAEMTLPDGTVLSTDDPAAARVLSLYLGADCAPASSPGGFFDDRPLHLVTDASLRSLRAAFPLDFDRRRFRPNLLVSVAGDGFPELAWVGRTVAVGGARIAVAKTTKRCVMTTLPQPGLPEERGVLPAVVKEGGALGVYGAVVADGVLRVGDLVSA